MGTSETIFLTGFPGFIAGRLLRRLAAEPFKFLLLVQAAFIERARQEVREIAEQIGRSETEFRILEGDITEPNLGLSAQDLESARREATVIFHLAALYDLAVARDIALRVNLEGTRNVNQFARSVSKLRQYHYVSTCYVAGKREGPIFEDELQHDAGFRNNYEETKYLAEVEVQNLKSELPVTIHRPAVVCGDSQTGETVKYDGIYYLIHYLLKRPRFNSFFNIGNREVSLNLVPVDFVVEALAVLTSEPRAIGETLQIADPYPLTTYELFNTIARCINGTGSRITLPAGLVEFSLMLPTSPAITGLPHHAVPYFFIKQTYDTIESSRLLASHDVHCPAFPSYVQAIVDFAARHPVLK
jgi:thioester reductase-like protein